MEGEIEQVEQAAEIQQPEPQPEASSAPENQAATSEILPGEAGQLGQPAESLALIPEARPSIAALEGKIATAGNEYTKEEAFYLENGWKAYMQEYPNGYSLEDIARSEKLGAEDIKKGIEEGIIKDPKAIQLYGQTKLDTDKQYYTKWALDHVDDNWVQERSKLLIAMTEQECLPLANGNTKDLLAYSNQQATYRAEEARHITDNEQRAKVDEIAAHWTAMSEQLEEKEAKEKSTDEASEAPEQSATPEQQQVQELQTQLDQLKTQHEKLLAENTALRDALTQATTELQEVREALENDEAIAPEEKEHLLLVVIKIIGALAAKTLLDATDSIEQQ